MIALKILHMRQPDEGATPHAQRRGHAGRSFEPALAFLEQSTLGPEPKECAGQFRGLRRQRFGTESPLERCAHVFLFDAQSPQTGDLAVPPQGLLSAAEFAKHVVKVEISQPIGVAGLQESFPRILMNGFEQSVSAPAFDVILQGHQRLSNEPRQQVERH